MRCPTGSASTVDSCFPHDWSPETAMTSASTPPKSPFKIREMGPLLLPRVRPQDQLMEPATASCPSHARTSSLPSNPYVTPFGGHLPLRSGMDHRSTSPPDHIYQVPSPACAPSPLDHMADDHVTSRRPSLSHARAHSTSNIRLHSRSGSSSNIDASTLSRFGYPTYRQSPTPQPAGSVLMARTPSAMNHLTPIAMPAGHMQSYPQRRRTASPPANPSRLSSEIDFDPVLDMQTSTALKYLTAPNPASSLTQRTVEALRGQNRHFWYDVRNVRPWSDFNVSAITSVPILMDLLRYPVALRDLPNPGKVNTNPETPAQLAESCATHHAVKVNAALKLTQGERHVAMRALTGTSGSRQQPEFVSNYQSDVEKTIYGDGRGRVVGVVKCYDQWNSGMRAGLPGERVKYLQGLAHLHYFMREHGTRYGFIMTEIELICVRAGGAPTTQDGDNNPNMPPNVPLFGFVEVAAPVQIATSGPSEAGNLRMTAGLALWWLHTLASRDEPFPGQYHWRLDVGAPSARTRQFHRPRDDWMPKPNLSEKREAKRIRGWVFPDEPLSKRECGRNRRKAWGDERGEGGGKV